MNTQNSRREKIFTFVRVGVHPEQERIDGRGSAVLKELERFWQKRYQLSAAMRGSILKTKLPYCPSLWKTSLSLGAV